MRLCNLTYEEALRRHPEEVAKVIQKFRKSRSKHRLAEPETLTWGYQTGVRYESLPLQDLIEGSVMPRKIPNTAEELAQDQTNRTLTFLCAEIEQACYTEKVPNPPEVYSKALEIWGEFKKMSDLGFA